LTPEAQIVDNGEQTNVTAYVTADGAPVTGATVQFSSDNGGTFSTTTQQGSGYYNTVFTAPSFTEATTCTITASSSKTGYANFQATTYITVEPLNSTLNSASASQDSNSTINVPTTIQLLVEGSSGKPLSNANVTSSSQPAGVNPLSGVTNSTGYVIFQNVTAGQYTFRITKKGFEQIFDPVDVKGQPITISIALSASSSDSSSKGSFPIMLIALVIVVIVVIIVIIVVLVKRRSDSSDLQDVSYQQNSFFSISRQH